MFVKDKIRDKFLKTLNFTIKRLEILNSKISYIEADAFNSVVFGQNLETIVIDNVDQTNDVNFRLVKWKGLPKLISLSIVNFPALSPDSKALSIFNASLVELTIKVASPWLVHLQLGVENVKFKNLKTLDLRENQLASINALMFSAVAETVENLHLQNSGIELIEEGTFDEFGTLLNLDLSSNELKTLPWGVFTRIFQNEDLIISLDSNKWLCDCNLVELQDLMKDRPEAFAKPLKCDSPDDLKNFAIVDVNLCPVETTIQFQPSSNVCANGSCTTTTQPNTEETTSEVPTIPPSTTAVTDTPTTLPPKTNAPTSKPTTGTPTTKPRTTESATDPSTEETTETTDGNF